jgi:iron complex transport system substrate-binding protein
MNRKQYTMVVVLMALMALLTACAGTDLPEPTDIVVDEPTEIPPTAEPTEGPTAEPESEPIVVSDDLGQEISLDEPAQRVISISPSLTEILFGIGAGDRLIGRDSNSTFPEEALQAADLGGMWDGIPVEDILALEPDLILAGEIYSADDVAELRDLGLNVYWQANPDDFEGLYENIRDIAALTGTEDQAESLVDELSSQVAELDEKLAPIEEVPLVFYELDASEPANPWTTGAGTFISYVINRAKGQNLGDSLEGEWVQISSEALVAENPDVIILADEIYGVSADSVAERAGWGEIKAVQEGSIYGLDPFILSVPGPRLVDGYQAVALILHPEIFE